MKKKKTGRMETSLFRSTHCKYGSHMKMNFNEP